MRILLQELAGNGTAHCPPLTIETEKDDSIGCAYTNWAYALFALVALIIVGIPFVAFICYVHRRVQNKHRAREFTCSTSRESSSVYPYQPLHSDRSGHATNYGAIDSGAEDHQAVRSPSHASTGSLADRLSQQQDTTSVASSRASVIPTYDDVSLSYRNAVANKTQGGDGANQPAAKTTAQRSSKSPHLSADGQEKSVDQGGQFYDFVDVVSNVPKLQNQTAPKDQTKQAPPKPPRQQVTSDANTATTANPVYDEVEGSELEGIFQPPSNDAPVVDVPGGAKSNKADDSSSPENGDKNSHGSPEYAVLEPFPEFHKDSLPPTEDQTQLNDNNQENVSAREQKQSLLSDDKQPATDSLAEMANESLPSENKHLTVLPPTPPQQSDPLSDNTALLQSSEDLDQFSVSPTDKSAAKSRTDFEAFLLGKVRTMPANERNGTFLVRDSVSVSGSKVLTMYCWKSDKNKELYNFKVSLTEDGQVHLHKSSRKFSDLSGLLEYLREDKDMLPCVLTGQVFP